MLYPPRTISSSCRPPNPPSTDRIVRLAGDIPTSNEDFLGSHILRIIPSSITIKEGSVRESRGKAKTYSTVNSRTVILKENIVYSNKGFKQLTQASRLIDELYYSPGPETQQWLVYYITKPLTGMFEDPIKPAVIGESQNAMTTTTTTTTTAASTASSSEPPTPKKKDIKSFNELFE